MRFPVALVALVSLAACAGPAVTHDATAPDATSALDGVTPDESVVSDTPIARDGVDAPVADGTGACPVCDAFANPRSAGRVNFDALDEASDILPSRTTPGVWFAHNDSGDTARFFALSATGAHLATFEVDGARATDWEDMTATPCPAGRCLILGDTGDNNHNRDDVSLYRVTEPAVDLTVTEPALLTVPSERMRVTYPDRAHNVEALLASPDGTLYALTKEDDGHTVVFSFGLFRAGERITAVPVGALELSSLPSPLVTGADAHPCAPRVLVRTYAAVYQLSAPAGSAFEAVFRAPLVRMPTPSEPQGESVAWTLDGRGYRTLSEGRGQPFFEARCAE